MYKGPHKHHMLHSKMEHPPGQPMHDNHQKGMHHSHHPKESLENHHTHGVDKHAGHHVGDFRKRFYISLLFTIPIMLLSPMIQMFLGVSWRFPYDTFLLFLLSSFVFFFGGKPF